MCVPWIPGRVCVSVRVMDTHFVNAAQGDQGRICEAPPLARARAVAVAPPKHKAAPPSAIAARLSQQPHTRTHSNLPAFLRMDADVACQGSLGVECGNRCP